MGDFRDPAVVESWHATQLSHFARGEQLDMLLALVERAATARVLDVGVGSGLVAERVLDLLPTTQLVGIDFSPAMLEWLDGAGLQPDVLDLRANYALIAARR